MNIKVTERLYDEPRPGTPRTIPDDLDIHLIMDNYATHKTPAIRNWLARHPHWHVHFTPTGASWLNMVDASLPKLQNSKSNGECTVANASLLKRSQAIQNPFTHFHPYGYYLPRPDDEFQSMPAGIKLPAG